jgi:hypothetical protein
LDVHQETTPRHHLLIAGTGRAGTSALVRYLTHLGLETHLSRRGKTADWHEGAQAGLEDLLASSITPDLPYVVKSPWSYQIINEVLADPCVRLDAVIVPLRDLVEAASSRTILELQQLHQNVSWMTQLQATWEHWGSTPGGVVFSLNPVDQARLLAVGLHRLLERLVEAEVPVILLAFPKYAGDADYLFRTLRPLLPPEISAERAREAHAQTFRTAKVRVDRELDGSNLPMRVTDGLQVPDMLVLDNAALKRELLDTREKMHELADRLAAMEHERDALKAPIRALHKSIFRKVTKPLRALSRSAYHLVSS